MLIGRAKRRIQEKGGRGGCNVFLWDGKKYEFPILLGVWRYFVMMSSWRGGSRIFSNLLFQDKTCTKKNVTLMLQCKIN